MKTESIPFGARIRKVGSRGNDKDLEMSTSNQSPLELTSRQQDLLLEGLRFVTSSVRLRREDPTPETVTARKDKIQEIRELASLIEGSAPASIAVNS